MTFLAPGAGLIAAGICLPIVVLLYFLKLRRRPLRVSSTLLWERTVRDLQVNAPFRWLRPSLLLLLQILALAALCFAAARPALNLDARPGGRIVLLIDRSGSMGALDGASGQSPSGGKASRLAQAIDSALSTARSAITAGGAEVCVISFAAAPSTLSPFTQDLATVEDALNSITIADQPGDLAAALELSRTLTAGNGDESDRAPTFILFSDGANPAPSAPLRAPADFRYVRCGPAPGAGVENSGVVQINARRDFEDPGSVRVFARLLNARTTPRTERVELTLNGRPAASTAIEIPASTPAGPGEASVSFDLATSEGGVVSIALSGGDALAADDAAWMTLSPALRPRIVVVARDTQSPDPFLLGALRALPPASLAVQSQGAPIAPDTDLVVFDGIDATPAAARFPSISIGAGIPAAGVTVGSASDPRPTGVITWERAHPLLRYAPLDTIVVDPPLAVTLPSPSPRSWLVLAHGADGPLIATFDDQGVRRVLLAFSLNRSNWGPHYSFPLFIAAATDFLTLRGESQAGRWHSTTVGVSLTPSPGAPSVALTSPLLTRSVPVAAEDRARPVSLGLLERAGLYEAAGSTLVPPAVAVNMASPAESLAWPAASLETGAIGSAPVVSAATGPREVWPWFIVAALVLLTIEWLLYAWQMRS